MSRMYIDAITLLKNKPTPPDSLDAKGVEGFRCCLHRYNSQIERQIANRDTDVVEVVRCKDCIYSGCYGTICRYNVGRAVSPDHYCSYGERREDGTS